MISIDVEIPDWIFFRQALSLSLLTEKPVRLNHGCAFISGNREFEPVLADIENLVHSSGLGSMKRDGISISYYPARPAGWSYDIASGMFSAISEIILFLAPALFKREFRTVLNICGVTHSSLSYPISFINDSLFPMLEKAGLYGGIRLKRYGFYGSGQGLVEARIYPEEDGEKGPSLCRERIAAKRGSIVFSGLNMRHPEDMKALISSELHLDSNNVSIIEVLDSAGMGISASLFLDAEDSSGSGPQPCIVPVCFNIYNSAGDLVFDAEHNLEILTARLHEAAESIEKNILPGDFFRESSFFLRLAGKMPVKGGPGNGGYPEPDLVDLFLG